MPPRGLHRNVLAAVDRENPDGARLRPQTTSRQVGILFGLAGRTPFDRGAPGRPWPTSP
ncbi:MAG: hypothetical protein Ct9H300mP12_05710 [Acidimicrobiales bacterium]|nr:MAG: hypothetical protein Ct9H300mP12_05710 [Acidimicrobiales bacterium]